jgi:hypothetical protein
MNADVCGASHAPVLAVQRYVGVRLAAGARPRRRARSGNLHHRPLWRWAGVQAVARCGRRSIGSLPTRHRRPARLRPASRLGVLQKRARLDRPASWAAACPVARRPDAASSLGSCAFAPAFTRLAFGACGQGRSCVLAAALGIARGLRSRPLRALALHVSTASGTRGYRAGSCGEGGVSDLNAWGAFAFGTMSFPAF